MEDSTSREKVLKKIRDALIEQTESPYPVLDQDTSVYQPLEEPPDVTFAQELVNVAGKFVYCEGDDDFLSSLQSFILEKNWPVLYCFDPVLQDFLKSGGIPFESDPSNITEARLGITRCEHLIARLGAVMVSSKLSPGRQINVFPEIHLVVAYPSQIVPDLKQAFQSIRKKYQSEFPSLISLITGPSRTADIEKTLVMGAHGPKELYVFLIENEPLIHER
jgi:L-lactate dehydrogenase complex protein LldG